MAEVGEQVGIAAQLRSQLRRFGLVLIQSKEKMNSTGQPAPVQFFSDSRQNRVILVWVVSCQEEQLDRFGASCNLRVSSLLRCFQRQTLGYWMGNHGDPFAFNRILNGQAVRHDRSLHDDVCGLPGCPGEKPGHDQAFGE